jgi:2,5-diamino-6-(ribosylamino)-4(3H)-pyrimidinone 5'-phosphate reductase
MKTILNCAMSVDGKIAMPNRRQTRISNEEDMKRVHLLRAKADAVLVGIGTILADDPKLTVKKEYIKVEKQPLRIVLDSMGRTPSKAEVLNGSADTLIVTNERCDISWEGAEVLRLGKDRTDLSSLLRRLGERGIETLLVEGGATVMWSFLKEGLADELSVFVGSMIIGGMKSPTLADGDGFESLENMRRLELLKVDRLGDGALLLYRVVR